MIAFSVPHTLMSDRRPAHHPRSSSRSGPWYAARACAIGLLAVAATGCSYCDDSADPASWHTTYISSAQAALIPGPGPIPPPDCDGAASAAQRAAKGAPGALVDPDLLEIARLEIERDCYREAENSLRHRVETLGKTTTGLKKTTTGLK